MDAITGSLTGYGNGSSTYQLISSSYLSTLSYQNAVKFLSTAQTGIISSTSIALTGASANSIRTRLYSDSFTTLLVDLGLRDPGLTSGATTYNVSTDATAAGLYAGLGTSIGMFAIHPIGANSGLSTFKLVSTDATKNTLQASVNVAGRLVYSGYSSAGVAKSGPINAAIMVVTGSSQNTGAHPSEFAAFNITSTTWSFDVKAVISDIKVTYGNSQVFLDFNQPVVLSDISRHFSLLVVTWGDTSSAIAAINPVPTVTLSIVTDLAVDPVRACVSSRCSAKVRSSDGTSNWVSVPRSTRLYEYIGSLVYEGDYYSVGTVVDHLRGLVAGDSVTFLATFLVAWFNLPLKNAPVDAITFMCADNWQFALSKYQAQYVFNCIEKISNALHILRSNSQVNALSALMSTPFSAGPTTWSPQEMPPLSEKIFRS